MGAPYCFSFASVLGIKKKEYLVYHSYFHIAPKIEYQCILKMNYPHI